MTKVVILQSNYIPWRGYFDLIRRADKFIFLDEVQYTRRDWRNRNKIVTPHGEKWLSIPVQQSGKYFQSIKETKIADQNWAAKHWQTISGIYKKAPGFSRWEPVFAPLYNRCAAATHLYAVNRMFITAIAAEIGLQSRFYDSSDFQSSEEPTQRLVDLCVAVGGSEYISGPAAKDYIDPDAFQAAGVELSWMQYPDYALYAQNDGEYRAGVSILDTLFMAPAQSPLAAQSEIAA